MEEEQSRKSAAIKSDKYKEPSVVNNTEQLEKVQETRVNRTR